MVNFLFVVQFVCLAALIICMVQLVRLQFLSRLVRKAIDETYDKRMATIGTNEDHRKYQYPDIDATYNGLKWYKPWQRPSTLLVYDKEI